MAEKLLTISAFAKLFKTTQYTIRHYEDKGLLLPAKIAENGYRQYGMAEAYQLSFILFLRALDLSVAEIKLILTTDYPEQTMLLNKKQALQQEIARLQALERTVDEQLQQATHETTYRVNQTIHLRVLKRLPFAQDFDLSVVEAIDWQPDLMVRQLYYVIDEAGITAADVDYVNAHGTGTVANELAESAALARVFGDEGTVPISSTKSMTGHLLGAAGALEAIVTIGALQAGTLPPNVGLQNTDPDCHVNLIKTPLAAPDAQYGMSNSFGFGGHNAVLLLKKWSD
ncbi:MerR family transcriptional regulator [Latilactobacillus sakei]|uniref:MerR family transcriptional regulator n=1 Tax=Latilactobacillus sakei TaxID=1599 RepID=UPI003F52A286